MIRSRAVDWLDAARQWMDADVDAWQPVPDMGPQAKAWRFEHLADWARLLADAARWTAPEYAAVARDADPPGWTMTATPAEAAASMPSGNG